MVGVLDGLHACGEGGGDVFGLVVDEEDVFGWGLQAFGGVLVDRGLGLGEVEGVGPGVVVEGFEPWWRARRPTSIASPMLERMPVRMPARWRRSAQSSMGGLRWPEVGVGGDEVGELRGSDDDTCA